MSKVKPINVKVSTKKVIDALQKALDTREKQLADYDKATKEYAKAVVDFHNSLSEMFRAGKGKVVSVSNSNSWREPSSNKYELTIEFPASVKPPQEVEPIKRGEWQYTQEIDELENAIAVLKMTDEETVGTNTYAGVARFIK